MKIWEFLEELDFFFPSNMKDENKKRLFSSYVENLEGIAIANKCEYDWKKVLQQIQCTYTYSKFPPLADIIKVLPECIIVKPYIECVGEGSPVVITLPNGVVYNFVISALGRSKETILDEIKTNYGYCDVKTHPKGTAVIGTQIVKP